VPEKTLVDTRDGAVFVTSARDDAGHTDRGRFHDGLFQVRQPDTTNARTTIALRGRVSQSCGSGAVSRRLVANAHRPFRTSGLYAAANPLGTIWVMKDRCDGTLTVVRRGDGVTVRDFTTDERIELHPGDRYFADKP
jgi:hypothetical protein